MKVKVKYLMIILMLTQLVSCKVLNSLDDEKNEYTIIKQSQGDINLDGIADLAVLASIENSDKGKIIILISDSNGFVTKKMENDNLTDGFVQLYNELPDIEIKNGEFVVSYYGGMCFRPFRNITFTFNKNLNNLYFDSIELGGHNVCNESEYETERKTSAEMRKIDFENFIDEI